MEGPLDYCQMKVHGQKGKTDYWKIHGSIMKMFNYENV